MITTLSTDGKTLLTNGTTYPIIILAVNANGDGAQSNVVNGTPAPAIQVIIVGNNRVTTLENNEYKIKFALLCFRKLERT